MASAADQTAPLQPGGRFRWTVVALLFCVITINYIDRQVLSVLKPLIEDDLGWSEVDYGNIVTAFQASYGIGMILVGRMLDKLGTRLGLIITITVWSIAALLHGAARSVLQFVLARAVLGVAEAGAYPGTVKSVAEWFPRRERALGVGILNAGANAAVVLTPLIGIWVAAVWGWRAAFYVTGGLGFLLLFFWIRVYRTPDEQPRLGAAERAWIEQDGEEKMAAPLGWREALRHRQTWAFMAGKFFTDPVWNLFLFWLPDFLAKTQGMELFPKGESGILATIGPAMIGVYLLADVGSVTGGWLSGHLIKRGWSVNAARKTTLLIAACCALPLVTVVGAPNPLVAVLIIGIATAGHQAFSSNIYALISDMYPRRAVATVAGIGGAAGSIGSILIAQATGWTLEITGSYVPIVTYAAVGYLLALGAIHLLVPRLDPAPVR